MYLLNKYKQAKEELLESINVPEAWYCYAIEDHSDMCWKLIGTDLYFGEDDIEMYSNECRSIVFRGLRMSAVAVRDYCSQDIFLMILDNNMEEI